MLLAPLFAFPMLKRDTKYERSGSRTANTIANGSRPNEVQPGLPLIPIPHHYPPTPTHKKTAEPGDHGRREVCQDVPGARGALPCRPGAVSRPSAKKS